MSTKIEYNDKVITFTEGEKIDIHCKDKKMTSDITVLVDQPEGNLPITENGEGIYVKEYATVDVNVQPKLQEKTATGNGDVLPDSGYDGLSKVIVAIPEEVPVYQNKTVTENGTYTADAGYDALSSVTVAVPESVPELQEKTVTPTKERQEVTADSGKDGLSKVVVDAIPSEYVVPVQYGGEVIIENTEEI